MKTKTFFNESPVGYEQAIKHATDDFDRWLNAVGPICIISHQTNISVAPNGCRFVYVINVVYRD